MEQEARLLVPNIGTYIISPSFLSNQLNKLKYLKKLNQYQGEIWLPIATVSPFHLVRLFFLGIKMLFVVGDKVVRIEHSKVKS